MVFGDGGFTTFQGFQGFQGLQGLLGLGLGLGFCLDLGLCLRLSYGWRMWSEIASLLLKIFLEPPWIHWFIISFPAQTCHELRTTSHFHPQHTSNHLSAGPSELLLARLFSALPQLWLWPRCRRQDGQVLYLNEGHIPTFGVQNHTSSACRDPKLTSNLVWSASSLRWNTSGMFIHTHFGIL